MYVFIPFIDIFFIIEKINGSNRLGWNVFWSLSDTGCSFLDCQTFSTMRYFPLRRIFCTVTYWVHGVFHPETLLAATFSTTRHFQLQFLGSSLITSSRNMKKEKKGYHIICSDRIIYIRLIQNESLTPTPTPHEQLNRLGSM